MKIRLRFSKRGTLTFIGHLDFLRVFQQTIRRAALPAAFSQGFNPHLQISFALPLPLGMESVNDYADLTLADEMPCAEITTRLNAAAPDGLTVHEAYPAEDKAASVVVAADYLLEIMTLGALPPNPHEGVNAPLHETALRAVSGRITEILRAEKIIVPKKTKKGIKDTDIRPDIIAIELCDSEEVEPGGMCGNSHGSPVPTSRLARMRLSAGSARFLNPLIVAELILGEKPSVSAITRLELYRANERNLVRL